MSKYWALIRRDTNVEYDKEQPLTLEFEDADMEKVLTAAEMILLHADTDVSVFIERRK